MNNRNKLLSTLKTQDWDLLIVGGGITGSGILREAVRHGLKALLVEQRDFAWGTSSRSGQLVHGGLRYLEQGNVKLTYESVRERESLLKELPGLVNECGMMMTFYQKSGIKRLIVRAALLVYDIMSRKFRKHKFPNSEISKLAPGINKKGLSGGLLFYESVTDDARLVMRVLHQAVDEGGTALNYCRVNELIKKENQVCGAILKDMINGETVEVKARQVINATGAWADKLRQQIRQKDSKHVRPLRGSHLVFSADRLPVTGNIVITHPTSKRPGFVMSWEGRVITGNTDIDHTADLDVEASVTAEEVNYLLENIQHHFPECEITRKDVIASFSGVRPVIDSGKSDPSAESRDHAVMNEDGLITVTGGKLTTFRLIALDVLKAAQGTLGPLAEPQNNKSFFTPLGDMSSLAGLFEDQLLLRLKGRYGNKVMEMVKLAKEGELEAIPGTKTIWAELRWIAGNEAIVHLEDLMLRRTRIGLLLDRGGREFIPRIREICQPILGWDDARWDQEALQYQQTWQRYHSIETST